MTSTKPTKKDDIYAQQRDLVGDFVFDAAVASVFPDMIQRSVPGYAAIINMIELLTGMHAVPETNLYDLGCSLGASSLAIAQGLQQDTCSIIAIDNAPAMLELARKNTADCAQLIDFRCADIRDVEIQNASLVVLNFTLQFLPPEDRLSLLTRIRAGLVPGGILILSEKILGESCEADEVLVSMHHAFKRANGYSDMEVSQKRSALENVLLPETIAVHQSRLSAAGFTRSDLWFQCFNFVSLVARA